MAEYLYSNHPTKRKLNGKKQSCLKHRAIWMEHYGEIPPGFVIHHIDMNKMNNKIDNLECISKQEHSLKHRLPNRIRIKYPSGAIKVKKLSANPFTKLS